MLVRVEIWLATASLHEADRPVVNAAEIAAEIQRLVGAVSRSMGACVAA